MQLRDKSGLPEAKQRLPTLTAHRNSLRSYTDKPRCPTLASNIRVSAGGARRRVLKKPVLGSFV